MAKEIMNVGIMHGHSEEYKKIRELVEKMGFEPRILIEEFQTETILKNFRNLIWNDAHCVIVILTGDDMTIDNKKRARQNVIFELGYCFASFDSIEKNRYYSTKNALIVMVEKDIELFANIGGLQHIIFEKDKIQDKLEILRIALENTYKKATKYYEVTRNWITEKEVVKKEVVKKRDTKRKKK